MISLDARALAVYPQAGMTNQTFINPRKRSEHEAPDSPWWALTDSFDAVTNGMQNPMAFEALSACTLPEMASWKALVRAVEALYRSDAASCRRALQDIPCDDPLAVLVPVFRLWLDGVGVVSLDVQNLPPALSRLYRTLMLPVHPQALLAGQAEEAIRQGLADRFDALASRLFVALDELLPSSVITFRLALRFIDVALESDMECEVVYSPFSRVFGDRVLLLRCMQALREGAATRAQDLLAAMENSFPPLFDRDLLNLLDALTSFERPRPAGNQLELAF